MSSTLPVMHPPQHGPGSVTGVPDLSPGFTYTFHSMMVDTGAVALHTIIGGDGPPLLLVGGWPQTWYAWRLIMPELARTHTIVVVEPRGIGLSDKPAGGYDTATLANDVMNTMAALGHHRFSMLGHDIGMWIGYALAADHPHVLDRLILMEAAIPGVSPSAPLLGSSKSNDRLWHFAFNRLSEVNEALVEGREHLFFSHQFRTKAATPTSIPDQAIDVYVSSLARSRDALRASFEFYRHLDATIAQNEQRAQRQVTIPILGVAGQANLGPLVADTLTLIATNVQNLVMTDVGHYPAEENPDALINAVSTFLKDTLYS